MSFELIRPWALSFWRAVSASILAVIVFYFLLIGISLDVPSGALQRTVLLGIIGCCAVLTLYFIEQKKPASLFMLYFMAGVYLGVCLPFLPHFKHFPVWFSVGLLVILLIGSIGLLVLPKKHLNWIALAGALLGAMCILTEWSVGQTRPHKNTELEKINVNGVVASESLNIIQRDAWIHIDRGSYHFSILPILRFRDHNYHGFWSVIAEKDQKNYSPLFYEVGVISSVGECAEFRDELSSHYISYAENSEQCYIRGMSELRRKTYSHLNHAVYLQIRGHQQLSFMIQSIPDVSWKLRAGMPSVFIVVMPDQRIAVYSCSDKDKGPFQLLAQSEQPVMNDSLIWYDGKEKLAQMDISFWIQQASVLPSPTARDDIPQNSIECFIGGASDSSLAMFWFSYAGTSIGQGFQTVPHEPGIYRQGFSLDFE